MGPWLVVVHAGAGWHSPQRRKEYKAAMVDACLQAAMMLSIEDVNDRCQATEAVVAALSALENSPVTNAGRGSLLNECKEVQMDCGIMEGCTGGFGAVGALSNVRNPSQVAGLLLSQSHRALPLQRLPPMFVF